MTNIISQQGHTEKDVLGIKSPIITQKTQRKMKRIAEEIITHTQKTQRKMKRIVKENKRLIETTLSILEEVERRREKQKQLQDYIGVDGLKILNQQDFGKPTCSQVKLLKEGQKYQECCCYELEHKGQTHYEYDLHGSLKEAQFRGIKVLSNEDGAILEKELGKND